jgi:superfamily I DNA and/or RNA helicase
MMLFDKYQYNEEEIKKRGYSQHCMAENAEGTCFWVKWILGIEKNDIKLTMLRDRLRSLQGAKHPCLPDIIEYNFDTEQGAYAVVYKYLEDIESLENKVTALNIQNIMSGLIDLADCLNSLHSKYTINHGDIHPGNIFVDKNGQFFLIDFQLFEITRTLSQEKNIEIFAKDFAAPEKFDRLGSGFPYQSDIYSFGKIVDWIFREHKEEIPEEQNLELQRLLSDKPDNRPRWQEVIEFLKKNPVLSETKNIRIDRSRVQLPPELLSEFNTAPPIFDIAPNKPDNPRYSYFLNVVINNIVLTCSWIEIEHKLLINNIDYDNEYIEKKILYGEKLPFKVQFTENYNGHDLTPYFKKWFSKKQSQRSLRNQGKHIRSELQFYRELLEKELDVITQNSLRLKYSQWKRDDDGDLVFYIHDAEKNSERSFLLKHIENGNAVNSDGNEYIIQANADRKQNKDNVQFSGKPYEYEERRDRDNNSFYLFKIKDCELKEKDMPKSGYIFENTAQKDQEKRRQLDAITKAEKNEVQEPKLIYALFTPDQLPPAEFPSYDPLDCVYQKDKNGRELEYSSNQNKAIRNAVSKSPLSIIQGPPGTGKTTVITEIVFQILAKEPQAKILITSQTNNAVDQVLENLIKNRIPILRLNAVTALNIKEEVREHTLNKKLEHWKLQVKETAEKNFKNIQYDSIENEKLDQLHRDWLYIVSSIDENSEINKKLIDSIRVIGATCNHIAAKKYSSKWDFKFDYVIMDEAGKATIAESLVPIIMGNNLVFVGDHRQLRPMLTTTWTVEKWLREKFEKEADGLDGWDDYINRPSLFEQVITKIDQNYKSQLTECRRLPTEQVKLTSKYFYESEGDEAIEPVPREISEEHNLPLTINSSLLFIDIGSNYKNEKDKDKSSFNKESAKIVIDILKCLNKYDEIKKYSFGIIACYKAQYYLLKKETDKLKGRGDLNSVCKWQRPENKFLVSVVDRFQGLECDIIILDLVKSGASLDLGFMEVPNRINVALSRNKRLLVIVGDYHGIVNARTRKGEKAALQSYLENIKQKWIIPAERVQGLFK